MNLDKMWNNFLDYISRYYCGKEPALEHYKTEGAYIRVWEKGMKLIREGIAPETMQLMMEYEKWKILSGTELDETQKMEVMVMAKLIECVHQGDTATIADLVQNLSSGQLQAKYAKQLHTLRNQEKIEARYCKNVDEVFWAVEEHIQLEKELQKIRILFQMLEQEVSDEKIKACLNIGDTYLETVRGFNQINDNVWEIYESLEKQGAIPDSSVRKEYPDMNFEEARLYQLLLGFMQTENDGNP